MWGSRCTRLSIFLAATLASAARGEAQQPTIQEAPPIRITVNRVNVGVVVTDSQGRFIEGLRTEDFHVFDNGAEQPIASFLSVQEPAQVVLLIESGPAVRFLGKTYLQSAYNLLNSLAPDDRVAIAGYSRNPQLLWEFSPDKLATQVALRSLNFTNGFGELNLSSSLATTIDWLALFPGKKTIVLLSSGLDTSPQANWQSIQQKLNVSDIRILAVSLSGEIRKPAKVKKLSPEARTDRAFLKQGFAQADQSLRELSLATGGRVYFPKNEKDFARSYSEIAQIVRHEYSLTFAPPALDGKVHSIKVKVNRFWYHVDHRQAYLAQGTAAN
jgi:Ca-activated chloride channel family protein